MAATNAIEQFGYHSTPTSSSSKYEGNEKTHTPINHSAGSDRWSQLTDVICRIFLDDSNATLGSPSADLTPDWTNTLVAAAIHGIFTKAVDEGKQQIENHVFSSSRNKRIIERLRSLSMHIKDLATLDSLKEALCEDVKQKIKCECKQAFDNIDGQKGDVPKPAIEEMISALQEYWSNPRQTSDMMDNEVKTLEDRYHYHQQEKSARNWTRKIAAIFPDPAVLDILTSDISVAQAGWLALVDGFDLLYDGTNRAFGALIKRLQSSL